MLNTCRYYILVQDAVVVQVLRRAGAIPFVKTNVHQLMMGYECSNPVFGATTNPWNAARVPGTLDTIVVCVTGGTLNLRLCVCVCVCAVRRWKQWRRGGFVSDARMRVWYWIGYWWVGSNSGTFLWNLYTQTEYACDTLLCLSTVAGGAS
jgi:hypothetical protein